MTPDLNAIETSLGQLVGSAEREFLEIGDSLGRAVDMFGSLSSILAGLHRQLQGDDVEQAVRDLQLAMEDVGRLLDATDGAEPLLAALSALGPDMSRRLGVLQRIVNEVGSLAINGKIQSALVANHDIDFTVFTKEIGRLGLLAGQSTDQAAARLKEALSALQSAHAASADFAAREALELEAVRSRLETSLHTLADRRSRAAAAAGRVAERSRDIAARIADTVGELQINDSVCQRLEHVRTALGLSGSSDADLAAAIRRLQAAQLSDAADTYYAEVEKLLRNLGLLAAEIGEIRGDALSTLSGETGGLFVADITRDIQRAGELLASYDTARTRSQTMARAVADSFRAMAEDLAAIRSIDTDLRLMGLNATFKCGRLGNEGRALGVVAQELRVSSKRTEEVTREIAKLIDDGSRHAETLSAAGQDRCGSGKAIEVMRHSVGILSGIGEGLTHSSAEIESRCGEIDATLAKRVAAFDIHRRLRDLAVEQAPALENSGGGALPPDLVEELRDRLDRLYTMEQERQIHRGFTGEAAPAAQADAAESVDDLFF